MRRLARAWREALRSGRVISMWSIAAYVLLSVTVMAAPATGGTPAGLLTAVVASSACSVAALMLLGLLERVSRRPRLRAIAMATGVLLIAVVRPSLQDAWLLAVGALPPPADQLPFRILTNVVVWIVVFGAIAVVVDAWRSLRDTNALLCAVAAELDASQLRAARYASRAHEAVREAVSELRAALAGLRDGSQGPAVLGARLRAHAHALALLAEEPHERGAGARASRRRIRPELRVPPRGVVAVLYAVCLAPYAARAVPLPELALAAGIVLAGGYASDRVSRSTTLRRGGMPGSVLFVGCSAVVGSVLSALSLWLGAPWPLVPAFVYTALAVGVAACAGAIHGLRAEQRRLSGAVVAEQRASHAATAADREAVRAAAELLHRDGQGACVVFSIEHPHPAPEDVAMLARTLGGVADRLARVFVAPRPVLDASSLETLLNTWGRVVELGIEIDPDARKVLEADPVAASEVYEIVAEGLLNAVKHGRTRHADVLLRAVATGAGHRLRVAVRTPGPAASDVELRPASRVRALGAVLRPDGDGMVLEASIVPGPARTPAAVVSPEHAPERLAPWS